MSLRWSLLSLFISVEVRQALRNCNYCCPIPEWREPEIDFQKNKFIKKWSNHKIEGNKVGLKYFFISKTVFIFKIQWLFSDIRGTKMLQNFLISGTTETWSPVVASVVRTWKMLQNIPEGAEVWEYIKTHRNSTGDISGSTGIVWNICGPQLIIYCHGSIKTC